jgi:hypothetical protein
VFINGRRFANSAAKFWTWLMDEVAAKHPDCGAVELAAPGGKRDN